MIHRLCSSICLLLVASIGIGIAAAEDQRDELEQLGGADVTVVVNFKNARASFVLNALGGSGSFTVTLDESFRDVAVTMPKAESTVIEVLIELADMALLSYEVPSPDELIVSSKSED